MMTTATSPIIGAYLVKGTIGNTQLVGAPLVTYALVVVPGQHHVSGHVHVTQATENGNYSGNVTGKIFATGYGNVTQVVSLHGLIHPDGPMPLEIPFEAHLAINGEWVGTGGFSYGNVHVEHVPVKHLAG
ncbi:DUF1842 domain-containing protein [Undibacterium rugosum]|nr:DUF1842 domain-containing protein [Undibacterium rugosum]